MWYLNKSRIGKLKLSPSRVPKLGTDTDLKEEGTWDDRRRDGGTNSTLRIKEQEKRLTLNEHDDDDDIIWTWDAQWHSG